MKANKIEPQIEKKTNESKLPLRDLSVRYFIKRCYISTKYLFPSTIRGKNVATN